MKAFKFYLTIFITFILLPCGVKAQWTRINNSPALSRFIYFYNPQTGYVLKGNEIYKSVDAGNTWNLLPNNFDSFLSLSNIYFVSQDTGFLLLSNNLTFAYPVSAYVTYDGGNTWDSLLGPFDGAKLEFHFESPADWYFHMSSEWFTPEDSIFQTSDAGITWTKTGNTSQVQYDQLIGNLVQYKDSVVSPGLQKQFYKTIDGGATWSLLLTDNTPDAGIIDYSFLNNTDGYVLLFQYNPTDTINSGIYKTTDAGLTWNYYSLPSAIVSPQNMHFTDVNTGYIVSINNAQNRSDIYITEDGGQTWNIDFSSNPGEYFTSTISEYFQNIYVLADEIITKNTVTAIEETVLKDKNISVFPNPFSSETTVRINNDFNNATLSIYNSLGQEVREIKNVSGHDVIFPRNNLPNGLYFVSLKENNNIIAKEKLVITD